MPRWRSRRNRYGYPMNWFPYSYHQSGYMSCPYPSPYGCGYPCGGYPGGCPGGGGGYPPGYPGGNPFPNGCGAPPPQHPGPAPYWQPGPHTQDPGRRPPKFNGVRHIHPAGTAYVNIVKEKTPTSCNGVKFDFELLRMAPSMPLKQLVSSLNLSGLTTVSEMVEVGNGSWRTVKTVALSHADATKSLEQLGLARDELQGPAWLCVH